jgi:CRP-like cAMP-binding protein
MENGRARAPVLVCLTCGDPGARGDFGCPLCGRIDVGETTAPVRDPHLRLLARIAHTLAAHAQHAQIAQIGLADAHERVSRVRESHAEVVALRRRLEAQSALLHACLRTQGDRLGELRRAREQVRRALGEPQGGPRELGDAAAARERSVMVLDEDAELAERLSGKEHREASALLRAAVLMLEPGSWRPPGLSHAAYGYLVLDGLLSRQVKVGQAVAGEMLGPGDLVRPLDAPLIFSSLEPTSHWEVYERSRLAVLDERLSALITRWPTLAVALCERVLSRTHSLAHLLAISHLPRVEDRLLATLWYLADRWGRVSGEGILVPLRLTHQLLGELVGAQRPTITLAVGHLLERGRLSRTAEGTYLLHGEPPDLPAREYRAAASG